MKKHKALVAIIFIAMATLMTGCELLDGIFKTGIGIGIFIAVAVMLLIFFIIRGTRRR